MTHPSVTPIARGEVARRLAAITSLVLLVIGASAWNAGAATLASPLFSPKSDFATGYLPRCVAIGDLNGDGRPDLATANNDASTVSVLLGTGGGSFGPKSDFLTGNYPEAVAMGDFNGDGKLDLVLPNYGANTVSVLLGNGNGGFGPKGDYNTGGGPFGVAIADLNRDGKPDLAVTCAVSKTVAVLLGMGGGAFGPKNEFGVGSNPWSVVARDLNGDGKPDLAVANSTSNTVSVLLGAGDGSFGVKTDFAVASLPYSLAAGDLNGDGKPDLVVANFGSNTVSILPGNGDGTFSPKSDYGTGSRPWCVAIGDLNGDGKPDLAVANSGSNTVSALLGSGGGGFSVVSEYPTGTDPQGVAIGDLDGDNWPDLVVANRASNTVSVLINTLGWATTTSLTADPNPSVFGQPVTLTATVTPDTATGTVRFYDGPTVLGTATLAGGTATLVTSSLSRTGHSLTAEYLGDAFYNGSVSAAVPQVVNIAGTSTTVTASTNPSLFGQPVRFTAVVEATPPGGGTPTGTVQFSVDHVELGTPVALTGGSATSIAADALSVGHHDVQAVYSGDASFDASTSLVLTATVTSSGPAIVAVRDVPNDQGGQVFVTWHCTLDQPSVRIVTEYRVWRRVPYATRAGATGAALRDGPGAGAPDPERGPAAVDSSSRETFWEAIATLPAAQLVSYGYTAATTQDSMAGSNPYTAYFVQALTADPYVSYKSAPDSGYSVDNLAPAQPGPFTALYGPKGVALHWGASAERDLSEYRLYRGLTPNFVPGPGNLLVAQPDTGFYDAGGSSTFAYKLSARDLHGNESRFALVTPDGPVGTLAALLSAEVEGAVVRLRWLAAANPGLTATVYRRSPETAWAALGEVTADASGIMAWTDAQVTLGRRYGYRLGIRDGASEAFLGEAWIEIPTLTFALEGVRPNPSTGEALLASFSLPSAQPATLELFDLSGRRLLAREVGSLGPGRHQLDLGMGASLKAGMYVLRLTQGQQHQSLKAAVIR